MNLLSGLLLSINLYGVSLYKYVYMAIYVGM